MSKQKFKLTSDLVSVSTSPKEKTTTPPGLTGQKETLAPVKEKRTTITVVLDDSFKIEIKTWCARNNITVADAFKESFKLLTATYNQTS